jgi:hypothetical protein
MSSKRVVGKKAFSSFVQQMREAYPDLHYEVGQVRLYRYSCCYVSIQGTCGDTWGSAVYAVCVFVLGHLCSGFCCNASVRETQPGRCVFPCTTLLSAVAPAAATAAAGHNPALCNSSIVACSHFLPLRTLVVGVCDGIYVCV